MDISNTKTKKSDEISKKIFEDLVKEVDVEIKDILKDVKDLNKNIENNPK